MIEAVFTEFTTSITISGLFQWDYGQKLIIKGVDLDNVSEVHFSNNKLKEALVMPATKHGDSIECLIPDELLTKNTDINAWIYDVQPTSGETIRTVIMKVEPRAKPANFIETVPDAEIVLGDVVNMVNQNIKDNEQFKVDIEKDQEAFKDEVRDLMGDGLIDDSAINTTTSWSSSKIDTEIKNSTKQLNTDVSNLKTNALVKSDIQDASFSASKLWSSKKVNDELTEVKTETDTKVQGSLMQAIKIDYTIPSYAEVSQEILTENGQEANDDMKFYADIPLEQSLSTLHCKPMPKAGTKGKELMTYTCTMDGKVRCYFSDKPSDPYIVERIDLYKSNFLENLQDPAVFEEVYAAYLVEKEKRDKEYAEMQKAIAEKKAEEERVMKEKEQATQNRIASLETSTNEIKPKVNFMAKSQVNTAVMDYVENDEPLPVDIMELAEPMEWQPNTEYHKGDLFIYEGKQGFIKQDVSSLEIYKPFTQGTEALYGARPKAVNGVYPYVYNMALKKGMLVSHEGKTYKCIQDVNELLYEPSQVPAILEEL